MAVRTPLYWDGTSIVEMSASQIGKIQSRMAYLYGNATYRSVDLLVDGLGTSIRRMTDSRDIAGSQASDANRFSDNNTHISSNPAIDAGATTTYDQISLSVGTPTDPGDPNNLNYPLYYDGNGNLQAMTQTDFDDTFSNGATDLIVDGTDRGGTYRIFTDTTGLANHTLVSSTPVFTDQQYNKDYIHGGATSTTNISGVSPYDDRFTTSTADDQPVDIQNYYLWRTDQVANSDYPIPLFFNTDNQLEAKDSATVDALLGNAINYATTNNVNYRISYDVEGSGTDAFTISAAANTPAARGSSITDTTLNADVRINDQDGGDTYISQNLPTGTSETETTYTLKIYRY
jgi:hypothetical protein